jgi:hypothetical protein
VSTIKSPTRVHNNQGAGREATVPPTESGDPELRLLLTFTPFETNADILEVVASPVTVSQQAGCREKVRNLDSVGYDAHPLADLQIQALAGRNTSLGETHFWSVQYHRCFSIDLRRVATMHKTLKNLDRALQRQERRLGPPEKFTAYLARCAVALHISSFGLNTGDVTGWHDTNNYQWTGAPGMAWRVAERLSRWRRDGK